LREIDSVMFRMIAALLLSAVMATAAASAPPPISLYGQLPNVQRMTLSPDGTKWAAVMGDEKAAQIQVRSLADNKLLSVTPAEKSKVRSVTWAGNDHVIATISTTQNFDTGTGGVKRERYMLLVLDLSKGKAWRPLLDRIPNVLNAAVGSPQPVVRDGQQLVIVPGISFDSGYGAIALIEINLTKPAAKVGLVGAPETSRFVLDADGRAVAREDYDGKTGTYRLLLRDDGRFRKVYEEVAKLDPPGVYGFGKDASTLLLNSHKSGEWADYAINLTDGSMTRVEGFEADAVLRDRRSGLAIGLIDVGLEGNAYKFFDPKDQAMWRGITRAFPGEQVELESWSDDRQTLIVEVRGEKNGVSLFRINRPKGEIEFIADRYNGLGPELLNPVTAYRYKAADGLEIPAYLTLPRGRPAKGLPLIVLPHGGPEARDSAAFDWWSQALASRGYAVLQPQFRGSSGFGTPFRDAGHGEWGGKMQTDLSDGVRDLVAKGTVDAGRVCIAGASYGGYAAMAGVTVDSGVYRCASAVAGVSDLRRMLLWETRDTGGYNNPTLRYWQRFMGAKGAADTSVDPRSPARLAAKVTVPLQLIHGKDDTVVPIEQSRLMQDALKDAGKSVDWVELAGEDHWLSRPATRIAMLEAQIGFLEKHNPPN
jgi:dipeptidyl aminopeptidase/acylaminoacyl peptidase